MFSHPWRKFSFANDRFYRWQWEDFGHVLSNVWIVAQNNFTDWNRDKAFGFLLVYNYFHQFSNIYLRTLKNTSFMANRTSDVFAATLCKTKIHLPRIAKSTRQHVPLDRTIPCKNFDLVQSLHHINLIRNSCLQWYSISALGWTIFV